MSYTELVDGRCKPGGFLQLARKASSLTDRVDLLATMAVCAAYAKMLDPLDSTHTVWLRKLGTLQESRDVARHATADAPFPKDWVRLLLPDGCNMLHPGGWFAEMLLKECAAAWFVYG